jgi:predicted aldo/keto reductase-like oxidoreductase
MKYRVLGKTGLDVSVVGFGGIPIQRVEESEVAPIVNRALDLGINFFDTARSYSDSEAKLGAALRPYRKKVYIASKSMARTKVAMAEDIRGTLETMGLDYLDLYQMHNIKTNEELHTVQGPDGALAALLEAKSAGLVRHIGVTSHIKNFLLQILQTLQTKEVETAQFPFNPVELNGVPELLDLAGKINIGVIAMKPLAGGAFRHSELPLRFILNHPVSVAIPGMQSISEVEENATMGDNPAPLNDEEKKILGAEATKMGTNFCRRCEYCKPCQQGVDVPLVFLLDGYYQRYGLQDWARQRYQAMKVKPEACQECGECEERCPYHLPIRRMLKEAAARLD